MKRPEHLEISVDEQNVESLLSRLFDQKYTIQMSSGITNKLIKATSLVHPRVLLIRLYGNKSELMIDRKQEIEYLCFLSEHDEAAPIYYTFTNGMIYGYQDGFPLISYAEQEEESLTSSADIYPLVDLPVSIMKLVVEKMARFHNLPVSNNQSQFVATMKKWLKELKDPVINDVNADMASELEFLSGILPEHAVNSHNDLLLGNIILEPLNNSYKVHFIDFEYAFPNTRAFDIANFLNELCGFECNWSKFPDRPVIMELIDAYITESKCEINRDNFYDEICANVLASHYLWALWATIQSDISELDFDYKSYSVRRLQRYLVLKQEFRK
eukprot:NODE_154_length_15322_cov_0.584510.p6 type:complete len:328 gc:universal NODE_154_length_15322_cov_0.584510:3664-4647(+)